MWFGKEDSTQAHWRQDKIQNPKVFTETASSTQENSECGKAIQDGTVKGKKPKTSKGNVLEGRMDEGAVYKTCKIWNLNYLDMVFERNAGKLFTPSSKTMRQRTKGDRAQTIHWMISDRGHIYSPLAGK